MITSQDEPVVASVETLEMNVRKFDADWKSSGFSIPQLEGKFPRSRVSTYYLLVVLDFTGTLRCQLNKYIGPNKRVGWMFYVNS